MKKLAFLLFLIFTACSSPNLEPEFFLEIELNEEESSEDSNGTNEVLTIENNKAKYSWTYFGYHPDSDFDRKRKGSATLTDEELSELKDLISQEGLWVEVQEDQDTSLMGDSVELTFTLVDGEESVTTSISGMFWSVEEREGNIENLSTIYAVQELINFIEDLL